MRFTVQSTMLVACVCSALAGCSQNVSGLLTTGSTAPKKKLAASEVAATRIDPACLALQNRIALLQDEGTIGRVEKAATGVTSTVVIKRAALSKVAELNQANDEFRTSCSKLPSSAGTTEPAAVTAQAGAPPSKPQ